MKTIEIIDDGQDRYTLKCDTNILGRRYDNIAEELAIIKPAAEDGSACILIATYGGNVVDHIAVDGERVDITSNLSQYESINIGFSFTRPDGYIKGSEIKQFKFLPAQKPDGFVPEIATQQVSVDYLISYGFVNAKLEDGVLSFQNTNGDTIVSVLISSEGLQVQSDWAETDDTKTSYIKNKPTNLSEFNNDSGFLVANSEINDTTVTFSDISGNAANVTSGEKSSSLWAKVKNWFSRLRALAFKDKINNEDVADDAAIDQSKISGLEDVYAKQSGEYPDLSVGSATQATQDAQGRVIDETYATASGTEASLAEKQNITDNNLSTTAKTIVSAINENKASIDGLRENIIEQEHFKGFAQTASDVQKIVADINDFAYCINTGTIWIYGENGWADSQNPYPSDATPLSTTVPEMDGTASVGVSSSAARADHIHPTDISRASASALQSETQAREQAISTLQENLTAQISSKYTKPSTGIPATDLEETVQTTLEKAEETKGIPSGGTVGQILSKKTDSDYDVEWIDAPSGDTDNLLQQTYTLNRAAGITQGDMVNLGYSIGLELGKEYIVKYKLNGTEYTATTLFQNDTMGVTSPEGVPLLQQYFSVGSEGGYFPLMLQGNMEGVENYGFLFISDGYKVVGDQTFEVDANNTALYTRAVQSSQAGNAVSVELLSIEMADQMNDIISRTALPTASSDSPDFVQTTDGLVYKKSTISDGGLTYSYETLASQVDVTDIENQIGDISTILSSIVTVAEV